MGELVKLTSIWAVLVNKKEGRKEKGRKQVWLLYCQPVEDIKFGTWDENGLYNHDVLNSITWPDCIEFKFGNVHSAHSRAVGLYRCNSNPLLYDNKRSTGRLSVPHLYLSVPNFGNILNGFLMSRNALLVRGLYNLVLDRQKE